MLPNNKGFDYFKGSLGFDAVDYETFVSKSSFEGYDLRLNNKVKLLNIVINFRCINQ